MQEFPESPTILWIRSRLFCSLHREVTCGLNLDGSRPADFWNAETLKPVERWICPKYSEVTLQLHTAFRMGKHHCLSLNLNFHRINCKCLISLNIHQNQIDPYLHFKDVFLFLFLFSIDGSMVRPQGRLQLDSRDLFLS